MPDMQDVQRLRAVVSAPHVESFDYFLQTGLSRGIQDLEPSELDLVNPNQVRQDPNSIDWDDASMLQFWIEDVKVGQPTKPIRGHRQGPLLPRECRERGLAYAASIHGTFCYQILQRRNGIVMPGSRIIRLSKTFGDMPIVVLSHACHLRHMTPHQLVQVKEEHTELGGYFIVGGIERCIRLLQIPRRNFPTAIQRSNYKNRGNAYSDLGVAMRCSRWNNDQSSVTNTVHYLTNGCANLRFVAKKQEFLVPVVLIARALSGSEHPTSDADAAGGAGGGGLLTDEELYNRLVQGNESNTFLAARATLLLQDARSRYPHLNTSDECLAFLGSRFRRLTQRAQSTTDVQVGHYMLRHYIFIHLSNYKDKLECLFMVVRKLYALAAGECGIDNADSLQNQEILLPGHLISAFVKEKFDEYLQTLRLGVLTELRKDYDRTMTKLTDVKYWGKLVDRYFNRSGGSVGKKVQHFLSTGNIVSTTGLDLMQVSGFTIVAEKLNFLRYCAHFRSVHRGQFFMEMKTTAVRKLLPDQWGYLCPVHTPDGGPCGLLSHLSIKASVLSHPPDNDDETNAKLESLLYSLGVAPLGAGSTRRGGRAISSYLHVPVCLNGKVLGGAAPTLCRSIAVKLRQLKVHEPPSVPPNMEVALVPPGNPGAPYPGLFLFTCPARLVRPVLHRASGKTEYIGPFEQGFLDIACLDEDVREGISTHQELDPTNILSLIANLTPFSDQNQSPRNMYQCQMGKQTMGTPCHSFPYRSDNKLYRLHTPQAPLVQTATHGLFKMDEYPNGANAIVGKSGFFFHMYHFDCCLLISHPSVVSSLIVSQLY